MNGLNSLKNNLFYLIIKGYLLNKINHPFIISFIFIFLSFSLRALDNESHILKNKTEECFALSTQGMVVPFYGSSKDYLGVIKVLNLLKKDIGLVTGIEPEVCIDTLPESKEIAIIGTLGRNPIITKLVNEKKLNVDGIKGKWETFLIQVVEKPLPGIDKALVIIGSDKRGTIFGMFDLSEQIGVSPWYWWADVPIEKNPELFVLPGPYTQGEPAVKYRGIFINDEAPALSGWVYENYGNFNHVFYEKVFELILRMKGNYLWPAMWGRAFYDDDSLNPKLADEYGVVIGTSHHEPMMRAHDEWRRYGSGKWNYETNETVLKEFWKEGIQRMDSYESIVTMGMRGDGDEPMTEGTAIALLEKIVKDQREILEEVTGKPPESTPQIWALYKEVQDYYDKGMRVPDDVTLLLCDDNWGNVRKLPKLKDVPRSGGYGMYYHFDYVGGPRNYKWLNTIQIERVWEQMHLTYQYGVDRIWIVNVGDIKPMEFPISFFLDYAWDPERWPAERLPEYYKIWAKQQFGEKYSEIIGDILAKYTKYNARRKPEMLSPETYSLVNYREAERIIEEYDDLVNKANNIYEQLPGKYKDAFYQLVLHPVIACANLNDLYVTIGKNHLYAEQGRAATNDLANKAKELFAKDAEISNYYNKVLADGKWNHMMDQTHIGYTIWQQPDKNYMPEVKKIKISKNAEMAVAIKGSSLWWPKEKKDAVLPEFDPYNRQEYYIELFNRGAEPFQYEIKTEEDWLQGTPGKGEIIKEQRIWISINWDLIPSGKHHSFVNIIGSDGNQIKVKAIINNPEFPKPDQVNGFIEGNGYISMEAEHFTRVNETAAIQWLLIPNLGRTRSGITPIPVTSQSQNPGENSPYLEYQVYIFNDGEVNMEVYLSPTQNFNSTQGLRYAISFDNEAPQMINMHKEDTIPDWKYPEFWEQVVGNNINISASKYYINKPGEHVLKFWMIDPGIVLQKIVINTSELKSSYLGPPESFYQILKSK